MQKSTPTQAELTRQRIIDCAAQVIIYSGFQSAPIGEILHRADVSKGCFYHHFPTKKELGYAVLDALYTKVKSDIWEPILSSDNPLQSIINFYTQQDNQIDTTSIKHGCPINNLAQEMSPIDEGFRQRIEAIYDSWKKRLSKELKRCQRHGMMQKHVDANDIATLVIAVTQGATGIAKNAQNQQSFVEYTRGLSQYLKTLQCQPAKSKQKE